MWNYGFFNSVNGDRTYNADQMSKIFEGLISDGVYEAVGNKLAVQPNSGMTIQIATGRGWFNKRWVNNDSPYQLTLEDSDVTLNRYCAVCVRVNTEDSVRSAVPVLKYSEYATDPVKPTMVRSETINEYCLAYVYIPARANQIKASNIIDTRQNKSLCGWVTGLIDQITPDTLYSQFTDMFNEWFNGLVDIIDQDVETTLVNALPTPVTVTLTTTGWNTEKEKTVEVVNVSPTKTILVQPTDDTKDTWVKAGIRCVAQGVNTLTFKYDDMPTDNVEANVVFMGV